MEVYIYNIDDVFYVSFKEPVYTFSDGKSIPVVTSGDDEIPKSLAEYFCALPEKNTHVCVETRSHS